MRRQEHSNRFKRLRRTVNELVATVAGQPDRVMRKSVRHAIYETLGVRSRKYSVTVKGEDGKETVHKNMAIQVRMQAGSPRRIYQEAKKGLSHVQSDRRA